MSGINDGFGDLTNAEIVSNYQRWAHQVANARRSPYDANHDDLVQEALVEIWETLERKRGKVGATYLATAGRNRMTSVLRGRPMKGSPSEGGQTYRPTTVSADVVAEALPGLWDQLVAVDALSEVEIAYHHGEIVRAIASLKPQYRRYVVMRFWGGMRDVDIAADLGTTNKVVGTWWSRTIRPALRESLRHLETV